MKRARKQWRKVVRLRRDSDWGASDEGMQSEREGRSGVGTQAYMTAMA